MTSWPLAQFPLGAQTLLRSLYGALLALQLLQTLFVAHRFMASERYGGYMFSSRWADRLLRPNVVRAVTIVWLLCAIVLIVKGSLLAAAVNFVVARIFYVELRWHGISRGMGAPGQMNYWFAGLVLLLEIANRWDVGGSLRAIIVMTYRLDFAFIMFAAGLYKATAGYLQNNGAQSGMVNPLWGWWCRPLSRVKPRHAIFALFNLSAVLVEVLCAIAFLVPGISPYAGVFFALGFLVVGTLVRLTFLAEMVAVACILYLTPTDFFGSHLASAAPVTAQVSGPMGAVVAVLSALLIVYSIVLPFAYGGMWYNFYARKRLPQPIQRALDFWTRMGSLILWRVFTADLTNFFLEIDARNSKTGQEREILPTRRRDVLATLRRLHVGESITLASLFTTRRYYPTNDALFAKRISIYARSLDLLAGEVAVFTFNDISRGEDGWIFRRVSEFIVDPITATVREERIDPNFDVTEPAAGSPIFAGASPGSYAPTGEGFA